MENDFVYKSEKFQNRFTLQPKTPTNFKKYLGEIQSELF